MPTQSFAIRKAVALTCFGEQLLIDASGEPGQGTALALLICPPHEAVEAETKEMTLCRFAAEAKAVTQAIAHLI